jgi:hypothetical protein
VTVRRRIDQLIAEPAVADLGYAPDQRLVATALVGLRLLADEIDELERRPSNVSQPETDEEDEVAAQLADLTAQLKKLKKAVKKCSKKKNKKKEKK